MPGGSESVRRVVTMRRGMQLCGWWARHGFDAWRACSVVLCMLSGSVRERFEGICSSLPWKIRIADTLPTCKRCRSQHMSSACVCVYMFWPFTRNMGEFCNMWSGSPRMVGSSCLVEVLRCASSCVQDVPTQNFTPDVLYEPVFDS